MTSFMQTVIIIGVAVGQQFRNGALDGYYVDLFAGSASGAVASPKADFNCESLPMLNDALTLTTSTTN